jgi:acyl-CoA thioester hydrolase
LTIGPIIFREECVFKKEIRFGDEVTIDLNLIKARKDFSRLSVRHHIMKNKETLSAILTLDVAWLNIIERKLALPPQQVSTVMNAMPKAKDFEWLDK